MVKKQSKSPERFFRVPEGTVRIRIIPNIISPGLPFIRLKYYYKTEEGTLLSPASFGDIDPVVEYARKLQNSADPADRSRGSVLLPKDRWCFPIVVRNSKGAIDWSVGVKIWSVGIQLFDTIITAVQTSTYGNIFDYDKGHDLILSTSLGSRNFADTSIVIVDDVCPVSEREEDIDTMIEEQMKIKAFLKPADDNTMKKYYESVLESKPSNHVGRKTSESVGIMSRDELMKKYLKFKS